MVMIHANVGSDVARRISHFPEYGEPGIPIMPGCRLISMIFPQRTPLVKSA